MDEFSSDLSQQTLEATRQHHTHTKVGIMKRWLIFTITLCSMAVKSGYSQSETGFEVWPDPNACETFFVSPPPKLPIIQADMPWDVGLAYMVLDTICKTYTNQDVNDRIEQLSDDSLLIAWQIYNRARDYDSFMLSYQGSYLWDNPPSDYKTIWSQVLLHLNMEYYKRFYGVPKSEYKGPNTDNPDEFILRAEGIYRIRVLGVTARTDMDYVYRLGPSENTIQCADVEVMNVYFGQHYYFACNPEEYELPGGASCLRLSWPERTSDSLSAVRSRLLSNHEYLVFIGYYHTTSHNSGQTALPWRVGILRKFEIVDGNLLDPESYFRGDTSIPFEEIETRIQDTINNATGR